MVKDWFDLISYSRVKTLLIIYSLCVNYRCIIFLYFIIYKYFSFQFFHNSCMWLNIHYIITSVICKFSMFSILIFYCVCVCWMYIVFYWYLRITLSNLLWGYFCFLFNFFLLLNSYNIFFNGRWISIGIIKQC
jgi:hypothetical protein